MHAYIKVEITLHQYTGYDKNEGRHFLRFTPQLETVTCCSGSLSFPAYEAWLDEPHTHEEQRREAIANAKLTLQAIADQLNRSTIGAAK